MTSPLLILFFRGYYSIELVSLAKRRIAQSVFVLLVALSYAFGVSLALRGVNIAVQILTTAFVFILAKLSFDLRPKILGTTVGILSLLGVLVLVLSLVEPLTTMFDSQKTVDIGDAMYCRQSTGFGFVSTDAGTNFEVFKRYLFIDKLVEKQWRSDYEPESFTPENEAISRCLAAFYKGV